MAGLARAYLRPADSGLNARTAAAEPRSFGPMYDFDAGLKATAADIERELDRLLTAGALAGPGQPPERLIAAMRHGSLNGGKRLRPLLVRQAAAIFGVAAEATLTAGLAVELVHCYSLIHD